MASGPLTTASAPPEASPDSRWVDEPAPTAALRGSSTRRWLQQHRLAVLVVGALLGVALLLAWLQWLASQAHLPGRWAAAAPRGLVLQTAPSNTALVGQVGRTLERVSTPAGASLLPQADWLPARPRWVADDGQRQAWRARQMPLAEALAAVNAIEAAPSAAPPAPWVLQFEGGEQLVLTPAPRGLAGLGVVCWTLALLALGLLLSALLVAVTQPGLPAGLYVVLALCHVLMLAITSAEALPGLGQPLAASAGAGTLWFFAELGTSAALVHLLWRLARPHTLPRWLPAALWGGAVLAAGLAASGWLPAAPVVVLLLTLTAMAVAAWQLLAAARLDGTPLAQHLLPLCLGGAAGLLAMGLGWWLLGDATGGTESAMTQLVPVWTASVAGAVLAGPVLARPRQSLREWLVVLVVAASALLLALLLITGLDLDWRAALGIALALALTGFAAARPLIDRHLAGIGTLSAERLFDGLYRAARALEQSPQRSSELVAELLREVFDPLEVTRNGRPLSRVRVARDGSAMAVPVPELDDSGATGRGQRTVLLRHARRGQRLFTDDDRQLAERLLEQLRRALAYDRAVERGRAEERTRIAQDLHDDIGARLLTLMYKAPDSEIEEYIRHTLQDLKTLTRGLAAANQRLSHAAAEWKADISQRLHPTGCDLHWSFSSDRDIVLNAMQWSGLTRVLRELVNNILAHAQATQVEVSLQFDGQWLAMQVIDDGIGRAPEGWSHGLGLGGVRKRVKQLGGQVHWREHGVRGIRCEVRVLLDTRPAGAPASPAAPPSRG